MFPFHERKNPHRIEFSSFTQRLQFVLRKQKPWSGILSPMYTFFLSIKSIYFDIVNDRVFFSRLVDDMQAIFLLK